VASGALLPTGAAATLSRRVPWAPRRSGPSIAKNTSRIASATGTAAYRVPDGLAGGVLTEVKNTGSLSLTGQIRDFAAHVKSNGLTFDLVVRANYKVDGAACRVIKKGRINLRFLNEKRAYDAA